MKAQIDSSQRILARRRFFLVNAEYLKLGVDELESDDGQLQQRFDFNKYLDGLYGYAMVLSRDHAQTEDLVQEACLVLFEE
jgi:hypothetical protein